MDDLLTFNADTALDAFAPVCWTPWPSDEEAYHTLWDNMAAMLNTVAQNVGLVDRFSFDSIAYAEIAVQLSSPVPVLPWVGAEEVQDISGVPRVYATYSLFRQHALPSHLTEGWTRDHVELAVCVIGLMLPGGALPEVIRQRAETATMQRREARKLALCGSDVRLAHLDAMMQRIQELGRRPTPPSPNTSATEASPPRMTMSLVSKEAMKSRVLAGRVGKQRVLRSSLYADEEDLG